MMYFNSYCETNIC